MVRMALIAGMLLAAGPWFGAGAQAQTYTSLGLGVVMPRGDLEDVYDAGLTFRGQRGVSLVLVDVHVQVGVTSFVLAGEPSSGDDEATVYHAGAGARLGLGPFWVGANGAYFFGDGEDGVGFFPEVGLRLWRLEAVADYRVDEGRQWLAARLGWRF